MKQLIVSFAAATMLPLAIQVALAEPPLQIARQGSLEVGGTVVECATNDGSDPNSKRWPSGHVVVDNVYATYQYPVEQNYRYRFCLIRGRPHRARLRYNARWPRGLADAFSTRGLCDLWRRPVNTGALRHRHLQNQRGPTRPRSNLRIACNQPLRFRIPPGSLFAGVRALASHSRTPNSRSKRLLITILRR